MICIYDLTLSSAIKRDLTILTEWWQQCITWWELLNAARQIICICKQQHTNHMEDDIKCILQDKQFHLTSRKLWLPQCIMGDDLHIWSYLVQNERGGERNTCWCSFRSLWVTLPLNLFFPTHFVLFPSALAVGRQSTLHKENNGFAAPTLGRHISTFRGYRILFSIQNRYIIRFTNH
jgi:hypothetical protein